MLYPAELRVPGDGSIARGACGQFLADDFMVQFLACGGITGKGSGATSTPSAISALAYAGATSPWMLARSFSP